MQVDVAGRAEMMLLRLNMTMLSLPCQGRRHQHRTLLHTTHCTALNLDLRDASGQRMTDSTLARGGLHKMRIDRWGKTMGVEYVYPGYNVDYHKLAQDRQVPILYVFFDNAHTSLTRRSKNWNGRSTTMRDVSWLARCS